MRVSQPDPFQARLSGGSETSIGLLPGCRAQIAHFVLRMKRQQAVRYIGIQIGDVLLQIRHEPMSDALF